MMLYGYMMVISWVNMAISWVTWLYDGYMMLHDIAQKHIYG